MKVLDFTPYSENKVDWLAFENNFSQMCCLLANTPQDKYHHSEGDVWTHTKMVVDSLLQTEEWQLLSDTNKRIMFLSTLLHDIAKPLCTEISEDGRVSSPGHSRKGSIDARLMLWREGLPFQEREIVTRLIGSHQKPFFILSKEDPILELRRLSREMPLDLLFLLAKSDALGRFTNPVNERQKTLDNIELARILASEEDILNKPYVPADEDTWLKYLDRNGIGIDPSYSIYQEQKPFKVYVMSGLPGMGKDTWVSKNLKELPIVSYDMTREIMGIEHGDDQGQLASIVKEQAKSYLRKRQSFVWNATHISPSMRQKTLGELNKYGAEVHIIYIEASNEKTWRSQNRNREAYVPEKAINAMLFKWEVPIDNEAHYISYVIDGKITPVINRPCLEPAVELNI